MEPIVSDMLVDPKYIGLEALMVPFLQHISTQRASMVAANIPQALAIHGSEYPMISTGWENLIGDFEFNSTARDNDVQILKIIPKFKPMLGSDNVKSIPTYTVLYLDTKTNKVGYFDRSSYTCLTNGFGYINKHVNVPKEGQFIPKDVVLTTSPNHHEDMYCFGVNANVAFLSAWDTTEDAFVISKSLAEKMAHTSISTIKIDIPENCIPLNLYGSEDDYRIIPDIDETVGDAHTMSPNNGILLALRPIDNDTYLASAISENLSIPQHLCDDVYVAPSGATILDIQCYMSNKTYNKLNNQPNSPFGQLLKYQRHHYTYYDEIVRQYQELKKLGYKMSSKFNCLVEHAMHLKSISSGNDDRKSLVLTDKKNIVNFITIKITYGFTRKVALGFKSVGRDGAKGVFSAIRDDEDMPIDEEGFRADILISPDSPVNRMNPGQQLEQFLNRCSEIIRQRCIRGELGSDSGAYNYIMGYIRDVRPVYADHIEQHIRSDKQKLEFVDLVRREGILLSIPPFCKEVGIEKTIYLSEKYNVSESRVSFNHTRRDGSKIKVTTKEPCCIGSKYIMLLGKIPLLMMSASEMTFVNQFNMPSKPTKSVPKGELLYGQTPIRFGEDEMCMLMMGLGPAVVSRLVSLYSHSPEATKLLCEALLTEPKPTQYNGLPMSNEEMRDLNVGIKLLTHMMGVVGYDISKNNIAKF